MVSWQHHRPGDAGPDNPFSGFESAKGDLWSLLDTPLGPLVSSVARLGDAHIALGDLEETDDAFILEVELPGVDKEDVEITLEGRRVLVRAERKERKREGIVRRRTRITGELRHEVVVPADVDETKIEATMEKGMLLVRLPKSEQTRRRRIRIT